MAKQRLRGLFGLFEGDPEDVVFAGAVGEVTWELSDDEEWDRILAELKRRAPEGTIDWREAWIEVEIEPGLFKPPTLSARAYPPQHPEGETQ